MNDVINLLMNHRSIRKYKDIPINRHTVNTIIRCGQCAPTSSHFQAYTIIEVQDQEKKTYLSEIAGGQRWVKEAPLVLLFCINLKRGWDYYEGSDRDVFGSTESYTVGVVDTALVMGKMLVAAEGLGLGGVVVGGIRNDVEGIWKKFKLPEMVAPLFLLCLGYPDEAPIVKPRLPQEEIHKINLYNDNMQDRLIDTYNKTIIEYYSNRTDGKVRDSWSKRCGNALMGKTRYEVGHFFRSIGFLKK